jgi:hypothetical protein
MQFERSGMRRQFGNGAASLNNRYSCAKQKIIFVDGKLHWQRDMRQRHGEKQMEEENVKIFQRK